MCLQQVFVSKRLWDFTITVDTHDFYSRNLGQEARL